MQVAAYELPEPISEALKAVQAQLEVTTSERQELNTYTEQAVERAEKLQKENEELQKANEEAVMDRQGLDAILGQNSGFCARALDLFKSLVVSEGHIQASLKMYA